MDLGLPLVWARRLIRQRPATQTIREYIGSLRAAILRDREAATTRDTRTAESVITKLATLQLSLRHLTNSPIASSSQLLYGLSQLCKALTDSIGFISNHDHSFQGPPQSDASATTFIHQSILHSFPTLARACNILAISVPHHDANELARLEAAEDYVLIVFRSLMTAITKTTSRLAQSRHSAHLPGDAPTTAETPPDNQANPPASAALAALLQKLLLACYNAFFVQNTSRAITDPHPHQNLHNSIQHHLLLRGGHLLRLTALDDSSEPGTTPSNQAAAVEARFLMPLIRVVLSDASRFNAARSGFISTPQSAEEAQLQKTRAALTRTLFDAMYGEEAFAYLGPGVPLPPVVAEEEARRLMEVVVPLGNEGEEQWFASEIAEAIGREFVEGVLWRNAPGDIAGGDREGESGWDRNRNHAGDGMDAG